MINWAEIDQDFLAVAKEYQDRYDGHGHFLAPGVKQMLDNPPCDNVFDSFEVKVSTGAPVTAENGMPVRFDLTSGDKKSWAICWIPSCEVSNSEGMGENELAFVTSYLKDHMTAMIYSDFMSRQPKAEEPKTE